MQLISYRYWQWFYINTSLNSILQNVTCREDFNKINNIVNFDVTDLNKRVMMEANFDTLRINSIMCCFVTVYTDCGNINHKLKNNVTLSHHECDYKIFC